ncbi:hypothetical protein [Mycolicibacterium diernhoferi]|uniref:hypothetical protein n=1 Tax=Mycolicibacterium diernhoferi TaxID=1801 RepID=UPI001054D27B|nr:hypothetical protein [Mycolicibacterium diernhoferi]QYL23732.1 hypothetical protein K0O62_05365 [Mycolicibacterium diernhoferi]
MVGPVGFISAAPNEVSVFVGTVPRIAIPANIDGWVSGTSVPVVEGGVVHVERLEDVTVKGALPGYLTAAAIP